MLGRWSGSKCGWNYIQPAHVSWICLTKLFAGT